MVVVSENGRMCSGELCGGEDGWRQQSVVLRPSGNDMEGGRSRCKENKQ